MGSTDTTAPPSMNMPLSPDADDESDATDTPVTETQTPGPVPIDPTAPIRYYQLVHMNWNESPEKLCSAEDLRAFYETHRQELNMYTMGYESGGEIPRYLDTKDMVEDVFGNEKYNEAFFEEHFLLLICLMEPSGSNRERVDSVFMENGTLTVGITSLANGGTDDEAFWTIVLELDKALAGLDVNIDIKKELWLPGTELPDTPGSWEGRDPYDAGYQREVGVAALDAMWRGDKEELAKYVILLPHDVESLITKVNELKDLLPPESGALSWQGDRFAQYPLSDGRVLKFNSISYFVVNRQVKVNIDLYIEG